MKSFKILAIAGGLAAALALGTAPVQAGGGHAMNGGMRMGGNPPGSAAHALPMLHGGEAVMASGHHFEALFMPKGIRLYAYDPDGNPVPMTNSMRASVTLTGTDGKRVTVPMSYLGPDSAAGRSQACFAGSFDFGNLGPGAKPAEFLVEGMDKSPVTFPAPVTVMPEALYTCSMHPDYRAEDPGKCPLCGMNLVPEGEAHGMPGMGMD